MIQLFSRLVGSQKSKEEALENLAMRETNQAKKHNTWSYFYSVFVQLISLP